MKRGRGFRCWLAGLLLPKGYLIMPEGEVSIVRNIVTRGPLTINLPAGAHYHKNPVRKRPLFDGTVNEVGEE
jgi:hypothetical protein